MNLKKSGFDNLIKDLHDQGAICYILDSDLMNLKKSGFDNLI